MDVITLIEPTAEPLTLDDAKTHLRLQADDDDPYVEALITVARQYVESTLGCALLTQTLRATFDTFPCHPQIRLPRWPVQSVVAVNYHDREGASQVYAPANYSLGTAGRIAYLRRGITEPWPTVRSIVGAASVDFVAGFASPAAVPKPIIHAMRLLVGHFYEVRQPAVIGTIVADAPLSVRALLTSQSVGWYQ